MLVCTINERTAWLEIQFVINPTVEKAMMEFKMLKAFQKLTRMRYLVMIYKHES